MGDADDAAECRPGVTDFSEKAVGLKAKDPSKVKTKITLTVTGLLREGVTRLGFRLAKPPSCSETP